MQSGFAFLLVMLSRMLNGSREQPAPRTHSEGVRLSEVLDVVKIPGSGSLQVQGHEAIRVATASTAGASTTNAVPVQ